MKLCLKILVSLALVGAALITSCAPKLTDREFPDPVIPSGNDSKDAHLNLRLRERGEAPPDLSWNGTISTAAYFDQAENLIKIGEKSERPALKQKGLAWIRYFYEVPNTTVMADLALSPFMNVAAAQTEQQVQSTLNEVLLQMEEARPIIIQHVLALGANLPDSPKTGLDGLILMAEDFNKRLVADIPKMKLPAVIEDGFKTELVKTTKPLFEELRQLSKSLKAAKTLSESLVYIDKAIAKFEVALTPELQKSLKLGHDLARRMDRMQDPQGALTVIVDIWQMLTPQERLEKIKPANEELYNFLLGQDLKDLNCLRTPGCLGGVIKGVVKKVFILPKIKNYGVQNIKAELNRQTVDYVKATIETFANDFMPTLPQSFADSIDAAWVAKQGRIAAVRQDFQSYVTRIAGVWSKKILPKTNGKIPGFEASSIEISANRKNELSIKSLIKPLELNGEVAGSAISANIYLMQNAEAKDELGFRSALAQINKMVALSGYRNTRDQLVPALLAPVAHTGKLLDIINFEEAKDVNYSFRLPNKIALQDGFMAAPELAYEKNFSASAMSAQIKGLSKMLRFTADWKKSSFDQFLGGIKAQDLTEDATSPELQQPLFPKDMLFALNVGTVSVLLQDLIKKVTPVFLLTLENKTLWANQYGDNSKETAVMAGIVDIKNGQRGNLVEAREVSKFILAMSEFIEALEGVEKTQSPLLLKKNIHGHPPLEAVLAGKRDLRRLSVAMANFISKKMTSEQDQVQSYYTLDRSVTSGNNTVLVDTQAYAVRALVKAYEVSGIEAYLWSATDIYFAMNKNLYSVKKEFYVNSDGTELSFPEKLNVLRALSDIKAYLPAESQQQLQKIANPWLDALTLLK